MLGPISRLQYKVDLLLGSATVIMKSKLSQLELNDVRKLFSDFLCGGYLTKHERRKLKNYFKGKEKNLGFTDYALKRKESSVIAGIDWIDKTYLDDGFIIGKLMEIEKLKYLLLND
jgi:hypothetical protein